MHEKKKEANLDNKTDGQISGSRRRKGERKNLELNFYSFLDFELVGLLKLLPTHQI